MTRIRFLGSIALFTALGLSGSALADDLTPPPWRGNPGTTVQHWDFSSGPSGFAPDALPLNNIYGSPLMTPSSGDTWLASAFGRNDIWAIAGGSLDFDIPNTGVQSHQKDLWLQVTFLSNAAVPPPSYAVTSSFGPFIPIGAPIDTFLANGWVHELTEWHTPICPSTERVSFFPSLAGAQVLVDQVVIDTQCIPVPSPGSVALLGFSGLVALRRRRSSNK
jgi:uncharacterized protein (TIGR03382 family)